MNRRETIKALAVTPMALSAVACGRDDLSDVRKKVDDALADGSLAGRMPEFFTEHEYRTVSLFADTIIPADDRSGSATDAHVPAFMDFTMVDRPTMQVPMRGGLAWLDHQCRRRFANAFVDCDDRQRAAVLDDIAYPETAPPGMERGVAFFTLFRDLTATGFWSSKMGVTDLQYSGNKALPEWNGCPSEALDHLGVAY